MPVRHEDDREPTTVSGVLRWLVLRPWDALGRGWNYKTAVLSSLSRGLLFFGTNLGAGYDAAVAAMLTELCFRFATAGFYGAMTQAFRRVEPAAAGTMAAMTILPLVAHSLELLVHWLSGTAALGLSIAASVAFSGVSTTFNLFAMRHGALVVGPGRRSLVSDLLAIPGLLARFAGATARTVVRTWG